MDDWKSKLDEMKAAREAQNTRKAVKLPSTGNLNNSNNNGGGFTTPSPSPSPPPSPSSSSAQNTPPLTPSSSNSSGAGGGGGGGFVKVNVSTNPLLKRTSLLDSSTRGADYRSLYETEVKLKEALEKEKEVKDKEIAMLKEKIIEFGLTDHAKQVIGQGGNLARELNLLKTEMKVNNMKFEAEVRRREAAEREAAELKDELRLLKEKRENPSLLIEKTKEAQRKRNIDRQATRLREKTEQAIAEKNAKSASASSSSSSTLSPSTSSTSGGSGSRRGNSSYRQSRKAEAVGSQKNIVQMITRVLDEMKKLENNIKKAENGRMQAEAELVEVAMFKQASDDALESVVNDVKVQLIFFGQQLNSIDTIVTSKLSAAPEVKTSLTTIHEKLLKIRGDIENRLDTGKNAIKDAAISENISKRASIYTEQVLCIPPPPPLLKINDQNAPPPPPPRMKMGEGGNGGEVSGNKQHRASTLLDQIRKGKNLNKIDVEIVKAEREKQHTSNRKSMSLLNSLQETLRAALAVRQDDMNLYDDDEFDDDEYWDE